MKSSYNFTRYLLALLFGASGTLAFSPFDYWIFSLISLIGLQLLLLQQPVKSAVRIGFLWGFGLFSTGISWVYISIQQFGEAPPVLAVLLVILLVVYLSLYPALFAGLLTRLWPQTNFCRLIFAAPVCWQLSEFLRGWILTGFPWLQFGYSQIDGPLKNLAPIMGVNSLNVMLIILSGLITLAIARRQIVTIIVAALLLYSPLLLNSVKWVHPDPQSETKFALIQGNIAQSLKWDPQYLADAIQTYQRLTIPLLGKSDIIIWPEAAIADLETNQQPLLNHLDQLARANHSALLLGVIDYQYHQQRHFYNTLLALGLTEPYIYSDNHRYRKHHLVPFGEFVPLDWLFRPIAQALNFPMSSMTPGAYIQAPLNINGRIMTAAICYEIILGEQIQANFRPDINFLLTISNDTWFGESIGPWQHFQMSRMRALELGRPLIRATNNGVTAVVNEQGDILSQLPQFQEGVLSYQLKGTSGLTPYARFGEWPIRGILLLCLILALISLRRKTSSQTLAQPLHYP